MWGGRVRRTEEKRAPGKISGLPFLLATSTPPSCPFLFLLHLHTMLLSVFLSQQITHFVSFPFFFSEGDPGSNCRGRSVQRQNKRPTRRSKTRPMSILNTCQRSWRDGGVWQSTVWNKQQQNKCFQELKKASMHHSILLPKFWAERAHQTKSPMEIWQREDGAVSCSSVTRLLHTLNILQECFGAFWKNRCFHCMSMSFFEGSCWYVFLICQTEMTHRNPIDCTHCSFFRKTSDWAGVCQ